MNRFGVGPGMSYGLPWNTMNQQQQGNQKPNPNDARFQPSQALRHHITERLVKQYDLLRRAQERLTGLITESNRGQAAFDHGGAKGPGDEQISAEKVEQIRSMGSGNGYGMPVGMARRGTRLPPMGQGWAGSNGLFDDPHGLMGGAGGFGGGRWSSRFPVRYADPPLATMGNGDIKENKEKMEKKKEKADPMWKYEQLEREIQMLMIMASTSAGPPSGNNPYAAMAMDWSGMSPTKAKDKQLKKILGPGKSGADSDDDEDDGPGPAMGGQRMLQQTVSPPPPMAPMGGQQVPLQNYPPAPPQQSYTQPMAPQQNFVPQQLPPGFMPPGQGGAGT